MDIDREITEHVAELRKRILRIVISLLILMPLLFYFSPALIDLFWKNLLEEEMFAYSPMEWLLLRLVFSLIFSVIILYPYAMLELYLFAKPGLYESERRFLKSVIIPSYLIFLFGVYFSYNFLIPLIYSFSSGNPFYSVEKTVLNAIKFSFTVGILLQVPFLIFLLEKFNIVSYKTMKEFRLPIYLVFLFLILNSSTDLGGLSQIAILISFIVIFELSLWILGLSKR
ncbi:MAG: twin-arginine translocase subunit TatC [Archaeoglobaceae archaeon]|nr:twin-arginine translocase subunit TatC [Archaeoglobaceae archaeon]